MKYEIQVAHLLHMCQLLGDSFPLLHLPRMAYIMLPFTVVNWYIRLEVKAC